MIPKGIPTSGDTALELSFSRVQSWISECLENHTCSPPTTQPLLPTRILDISNSTVQLAEGKGRCGRYVCLSHRWGNGWTIRTIKETVKSYGLNIQWEELSKTFQDAITFTRRLGISYIWIDSLCIIQDDPGDWHRESCKMATIYKNAFVTLAATTSNGGSSGMFSRVPGCTIEGTTSSGHTFQIHFRKAPRHLLYELDPELFPLLERGWVYQERLLSSRVIHFGAHELSWECAESVNCECRASKSSPLEAPKIAHRKALTTANSSVAAKRWRAVVSEYTTLQLTRSSDRLVALSGIADDFKSCRSDRYLAGLWEGSLVLDLLWHCVDRKLKPREKSAPSWSWASINSAISYHTAENSIQKQFAQVVAVDCNQVSQITPSGYMVISSQLVQLPIQLHQFAGVNFSNTFYPDYIGTSRLIKRGLLHGLLIARTEDAEVSLVLKRLSFESSTFERVGILRICPFGSEWFYNLTRWRACLYGVGYEEANKSTVVIL